MFYFVSFNNDRFHLMNNIDFCAYTLMWLLENKQTFKKPWVSLEIGHYYRQGTLTYTILQNIRFQNSVGWCSRLTREGEQRFKISTLGDARAVFGAGVPQVFKLPLGDNDAAGHGGNLPVVVSQRRSSDQPADHGHDEPRRFHSRRHDGNVSRKLLRWNVGETLRRNPTATNSLKTMKPLR